MKPDYWLRLGGPVPGNELGALGELVSDLVGEISLRARECPAAPAPPASGGFWVEFLFG